MMSVDSFASIHQGRCLKSRQHYPALQGAAKASALHRNIVSIATCKLRRERETGRGLDLHNQSFSNGSRTDSKQATNGAKMRGIFQANGFACEESTHKHWASTRHIHKAHSQGARTNIGHPQGTISTRHLKSKYCTQSEFQVAFCYFYVFSAAEILKTQELSERKHSQYICPWIPGTISAPLYLMLTHFSKQMPVLQKH